MNATKIYNWKGTLRGYQCENSFIPVEPQNRHYRELIQQIESGACVEQEPKIEEVEKINNTQGEHIGFKYLGMFIPIDNKNNLYNLIQRNINNKTCRCMESTLNNTYKKIHEFIISIFFPTPWKTVKDKCEITVPYPIGQKSLTKSYNVRYINLDIANKDGKLKLINNYYQPDIAFDTYFDKPLQVSLLEITIPLKDLCKIFSLQKENIRKSNPFLYDSFEMHMAQEQRSTKNVPLLSWLIPNAKELLREVAIHISNMAINVLMLEYGEPFRFVNQIYLEENYIIIRKYEDNELKFDYPSMYSNKNFDISGSINLNSYTLQLINNESPNLQFDAKYNSIPIAKIQQLIGMGFTLEVVCLLNTYLEVKLKNSFIRYLVLKSADASYFDSVDICDNFKSKLHKRITAIKGCGYGMRLEIIREMLDLNGFGQHLCDEINKYHSKALELYKHRNDYMHALETEEDTPFLSPQLRAVFGVPIMGTFAVVCNDFETGECIPLTDDDVAKYTHQFRL